MNATVEIPGHMLGTHNRYRQLLPLMVLIAVFSVAISFQLLRLIERSVKNELSELMRLVRDIHVALAEKRQRQTTVSTDSMETSAAQAEAKSRPTDGPSPTDGETAGGAASKAARKHARVRFADDETPLLTFENAE
ncbi:hypothetical protein QR680_000510 [Steinernema hermaphroditum]|uniref:Uncharacterized protein n=1 Tax=Steinernema hermaphroditum TaxID=289476 RepID=A0AA39GWD3_9BILA|nr:hypothetical protein QR680_000510 [Steinernema hermaphroditum]